VTYDRRIERVIALRPATRADADRLLAWRNDAATRDASRNHDPVTAADHETWLATVIRDNDRELLVGVLDSKPIGQVRFDRLEHERWEQSVTVAPSARGRGLGRALIAAGIEWLWATHPDARVVQASVRTHNHRSLRAFEACGFEAEGGAEDGYVRLERGPP
jgi:RimJ/RimL family protein N-acetyltransferase